MKMLTTILLGALLLQALPSLAQFSMTVKAGASLTNASLDKDMSQITGKLSYHSKGGFMAGIAVGMPLGGERFSLQPELLFHQKGYVSNYSSSGESSKYSITLNYLDLPVMARVHFGSVRLSAGPYFALGISGKYKGSNTYGGQTQERKGDVKFDKEPSGYIGSDIYYNAFDFGLAAGAGVNIRSIVIDLRFGLGLLDIKYRNFTENPVMNRSLQLTIGVPIFGRRWECGWQRDGFSDLRAL